MRSDSPQHVRFFRQQLKSWFRKKARVLPWRQTQDPYRIWISEVMLQQTTVRAVIPYYERWMRECPSVDDVARASEQKILKLWQGLGYYQRARNLHKAAKVICKTYGGQFPSSHDVLRSLPGFGPYTVGAVLSIAFGQRKSIVDANVRRVMMRQMGIQGKADAAVDKTIGSVLQVLLPYRGVRVFNEGLMELGATVCRSQDVLCHMCPVRKTCCAYARGIQEIIPEPKKRSIKKIEAAVAVIERNNKIFIQQRPEKGLMAGLWEFPGGKRKAGETMAQTLHREIEEELKVDVQSHRHLATVRHAYTQFSVTLHAYVCHVAPIPKNDDRHKWISRKALRSYPMPSGSAKVVEILLS